MLELHVAETTVNSSRIALGWCISPELGQKILDSQLEANLLIIVQNEANTVEVRQVVPLSDMLTYMDFKCSGQNKITARIVLGDSIKYLKSLFLDKAYGKYHTNVFDFENNLYNRARFHKYPDAVAVEDANLNVIVPANVFAKEPPEWEKRWVNKLFRTKAFDQCNYRRRRIFAYTIQPVLFILAFLGHTVLTTLLQLLTVKSINYGWIKDPLINPIDAYLADLEGVWIMPKSVSNTFAIGLGFNRGIFAPILFSLTPAFLILGTYILRHNHCSWLKAILLAPIFNLAIMLAFTIVVVVIGGVVWLLQDFKWMKLIIKAFEKLSGVKDEVDYLDAETIDSLTCTGNPKLKVSQLPKKARTVRLRFEEFKTKVCRPFSG